MSLIAYQIIFILLLLLANGVFAMSELAVVSARKSRLQRLANEGNKKAQAALALANEPNRFLSTIQVGITLVGILAGAYGGATIAEELAPYFKQFPLLANYSETIPLGLVVITITYLSLILGELVPKRIALNNPERIAMGVAIPMRTLAKLGGPVVHLLTASTDLMMRLLRIRPVPETPVTEDEIRDLIEQGTQAGTFDETEQTMMDRVFRFGDRRVTALMTPRTSLEWLDIDDAPEVNQRKIIESLYSRFPVYEGDTDNIIGLVQVRDLLILHLQGKPFDLKAALKEPLFISGSIRASGALELFKLNRTSVALIIDEYGSVQGMITLTDISEAIVGDIESEHDEAGDLVAQREDGSWLLDGMMPVEELKELLQITRMPDEEKNHYHTLAGFVITHLEHIPSVTSRFEWNGFCFEIVDMDGKRVDKVLVMPLLEKAGESAGE